MPVLKFLVTLGSLSLEISRVSNSQYPRAVVEPLPKVEYSINGSVVGDGPNFAPKSIWAINAFLKEEERDILIAIHSEFDYLRRTLQIADISLADYTLPYIERSPRTKALAPGTVEQTVEQNIGQLKYFATFKTWMVQPPQFENGGRYTLASFTLQEV